LRRRATAAGTTFPLAAPAAWKVPGMGTDHDAGRYRGLLLTGSGGGGGGGGGDAAALRPSGAAGRLGRPSPAIFAGGTVSSVDSRQRR
jgi:hypothetical protein